MSDSVSVGVDTENLAFMEIRLSDSKIRMADTAIFAFMVTQMSTHTYADAANFAFEKTLLFHSKSTDLDTANFAFMVETRLSDSTSKQRMWIG